MKPAFWGTIGLSLPLTFFYVLSSSQARDKEALAIIIKREKPPVSVEEVLEDIPTPLNLESVNDIEVVGKTGVALRSLLQDRLTDELGRHYVNRGLTRVLVRSLATLGDRQAEEVILAGMQSEHPVFRTHALEDAGIAKTPALVSALGDMLFSDIPDQSYTPGEVYPAPSRFAARILATIVENPPVPPIGHEKKLYTDEDVRIWREWWRSRRGIAVDDVYERSMDIAYPKQRQ